MNIDMKADGFENIEEMHHLAKCCASFELGPFSRQIARVYIRLAHLHQASVGKGKNCTVEVAFHDGDCVDAEAIDSSPQVAIHWALERAGWKIACRQQPELRDASSLPLAERRSGASDEHSRAA